MRKAVLLSPTVPTASKRMMLALLAACLVGMVVLFGVSIKSAETQTTAPSSYRVQDLGTLPEATYSPPTSVPYGINDSGHVVGYANVSVGSGYYFGYYEYAIGHAFLYDGAMQDLGTLEGGISSGATAINSSGQVVGNSVDGSWISHAFLYKDGVMKELSTLGTIMSSSGIVPGPDSQAYGINDSGQAVGLLQVYGTDYYSNNYHAFLWDSTNGMKDLGLLGGTYTNYYSNSQANGINTSGQVVGWSAYDDIGHVHAFLYKDGKMTDLGDLGTLGGTNSYAYGINNKGQVVGQAEYVDGGEWHAFLYDESATPKMKDLGTLGGTNSSAYGISDSGQVVGYSSPSSGSSSNHAFLYDKDTGMIDLGTRTHPDNNGNVWTLGAARGINNNGQIVIDGSRVDQNGTNVYSALLLTPTSDPPPADTQAPSAPTISSPPNNSYDSDGSFSVSGSAEAGSTVELFEGTTSKGTQKADSSTGAWSIPLSGVSEAAHTYSAKATDAAGNTSSASDSVTVTVDKTAPTVSSVSPASGATNVAPSTDVEATFSEDMNSSTLTTSTFTLTKQGNTTVVPATVSYDAATKKAMLDPNSDLEANTTYTATISTGAKDLAGNALAQNYTWSFNTAASPPDTTAPTVSTVSPADLTKGVDRATDVTAQFSEDLNPATLTTSTFTLVKSGSTQPISAKVSYDPASLTATLNPYGTSSTTLSRCTWYTAMLTTGVKDKTGNALAAPKVWQFKTKGC